MSDQQRKVSRQRLTDRERGKLAWENVSAVRDLAEAENEVKKKYRTQARQFASLVRTNGLAQALAFLYAKAKQVDSDDVKSEARAMQLVLSHVNTAVWRLFDPERQALESDYASLLKYLLDQPSYRHRQATVEALAFTRWLSRFAEAELPSDEETVTP